MAGRKRNIPEPSSVPSGLNLGIQSGAAIESRRSEQVKGRLLDDRKSAALEMMVLVEIERHLIRSKNRLNTYSDMKAEIEVLIKSAVGAKGRIDCEFQPGTRSNGRRQPHAGNQQHHQRKGPKAKVGARARGTCFNCGKPGHRTTGLLE